VRVDHECICSISGLRVELCKYRYHPPPLPFHPLFLSAVELPEDPFLWRGADGSWHSLHHAYPWPDGTHAFSTDGWNVSVLCEYQQVKLRMQKHSLLTNRRYDRLILNMVVLLPLLPVANILELQRQWCHVLEVPDTRTRRIHRPNRFFRQSGKCRLPRAPITSFQ
jgi:hypothetical protein